MYVINSNLIAPISTEHRSVRIPQSVRLAHAADKDKKEKGNEPFRVQKKNNIKKEKNKWNFNKKKRNIFFLLFST